MTMTFKRLNVHYNSVSWISLSHHHHFVYYGILVDCLRLTDVEYHHCQDSQNKIRIQFWFLYEIETIPWAFWHSRDRLKIHNIDTNKQIHQHFYVTGFGFSHRSYSVSSSVTVHNLSLMLENAGDEWVIKHQWRKKQKKNNILRKCKRTCKYSKSCNSINPLRDCLVFYCISCSSQKHLLNWITCPLGTSDGNNNKNNSDNNSQTELLVCLGTLSILFARIMIILFCFSIRFDIFPCKSFVSISFYYAMSDNSRVQK